ncbi:unnamed protein product, partial [Polarella glacialis]
VFDFSGDPWEKQIAKSDNFVFGTQIGDIAFFGYSGAHYWWEVESEVQAFCRFVGDTDTVHHIVLLGHWNGPDLGCKPGMQVPAVYDKMQGMPGCAGKRMISFMGHMHCNKVTNKGSGILDARSFMIGASGMLGACMSEFGVVVVESRDDVAYELDGKGIRVDYVPVTQDPSYGRNPNALRDNHNGIMGCLSGDGNWEKCRRLHAFSWRATTVDDIVGGAPPPLFVPKSVFVPTEPPSVSPIKFIGEAAETVGRALVILLLSAAVVVIIVFGVIRSGIVSVAYTPRAFGQVQPELESLSGSQYGPVLPPA